MDSNILIAVAIIAAAVAVIFYLRNQNKAGKPSPIDPPVSTGAASSSADGTQPAAAPPRPTDVAANGAGTLSPSSSAPPAPVPLTPVVATPAPPPVPLEDDLLGWLRKLIGPEAAARVYPRLRAYAAGRPGTETFSEMGMSFVAGAKPEEITADDWAYLQSRMQLVLWEQQVGTIGVSVPRMTPEEVAKTLVYFDAEPREDYRFFLLTVDEEFALQNRGMKRNDIKVLINKYSSGPAPEGYYASELAKHRDGYRIKP